MPCVAWESIAKSISQYVRKGDKLGVSGRITTRSYEDKNGQKRFVTEVIVEKFDLLGVKDKTEDEIFL